MSAMRIEGPALGCTKFNSDTNTEDRFIYKAHNHFDSLQFPEFAHKISCYPPMLGIPPVYSLQHATVTADFREFLELYLI